MHGGRTFADSPAVPVKFHLLNGCLTFLGKQHRATRKRVEGNFARRGDL